jgi:hypothetical protein
VDEEHYEHVDEPAVPVDTSLSGTFQTPDGAAGVQVSNSATGNVTSWVAGDETIVMGVATASSQTAFGFAAIDSGGLGGGSGQSQVIVRVVASDPNAEFGFDLAGTVSFVSNPGHIELGSSEGSVDTWTHAVVDITALGGREVDDGISVVAGSGTVPFSASGEGYSGMNTLLLAQASSVANTRGPRSMDLVAQTSVALTLRLFPLDGSTTTTTSTTTSTTASSTTTVSSTTTSTTLFVPGGSRDPYRLYAATGPDAPEVSLMTQCAAETVDLGAVQFYLAPAGVDGALPLSGTVALACYGHPGASFAGSAHVVHRFATQTLALGDPLAVCVPSEAGDPVDAYVCHGASGPSLSQTLALEDDFQTQAVDVGAPFAFCLPASVAGSTFVNPLAYLACYETTPPGAAAGPVAIENAFHVTTIDAGSPGVVCVPTLALVSQGF